MHSGQYVRHFLSRAKHIDIQADDPARTRTWNLLIRSQTPSPLGNEAASLGIYLRENVLFIANMI